MSSSTSLPVKRSRESDILLLPGFCASFRRARADECSSQSREDGYTLVCRSASLLRSQSIRLLLEACLPITRAWHSSIRSRNFLPRRALWTGFFRLSCTNRFVFLRFSSTRDYIAKTHASRWRRSQAQEGRRTRRRRGSARSWRQAGEAEHAGEEQARLELVSLASLFISPSIRGLRPWECWCCVHTGIGARAVSAGRLHMSDSEPDACICPYRSYVSTQTGLEDTLAHARKDGYLEKRDFLDRVEARKEEGWEKARGEARRRGGGAGGGAL